MYGSVDSWHFVFVTGTDPRWSINFVPLIDVISSDKRDLQNGGPEVAVTTGSKTSFPIAVLFCTFWHLWSALRTFLNYWSRFRDLECQDGLALTRSEDWNLRFLEGLGVVCALCRSQGVGGGRHRQVRRQRGRVRSPRPCIPSWMWRWPTRTKKTEKACSTIGFQVLYSFIIFWSFRRRWRIASGNARRSFPRCPKLQVPLSLPDMSRVVTRMRLSEVRSNGLVTVWQQECRNQLQRSKI